MDFFSGPGIIMSGVSAGAICWFEQGLTDSNSNTFEIIDSLGFLKGSFCRHYSNSDWIEACHQEIEAGRLLHTTAVEDDAAVHYIDGEPFRNVIAHSGAKVFNLLKTNHGVKRESLIKA